jgi:hypothetical protein
MIVSGVNVVADPTLSREEIIHLVAEEKRIWETRNKQIGLLELAIDGEEVVIKATEKSPIRRVRRITGYLSVIDNFNNAKAAECNDRVQHIRQ